MIKRSNSSKLCVIFGADAEIERRYRASVADALILFYEIGDIFEAVARSCKKHKIKTDTEISHIATEAFYVIDNDSFRIVEIPCGVHRLEIEKDIVAYSKIEADGENG